MGGRAFLEPEPASAPPPPAEAPPRWFALTDAWSKPIRGPLDRVSQTVDTPVGRLTVPELFDWAIVLGYSALTGYVIGKAAGNLAVIALGGPRRP
jgi:hypothetical protein